MGSPMAARKRGRRKTTQRRRSKSFNLLNAAELYVQTSILTQGMFNSNPIQFITGKTPVVGPGTTGVLGSAYNPNTGDSVITLPELMGLDSMGTTLQGPTGYRMSIKGGSFAADPSAALATITANTKASLVPMVIQTVGTRVFFKILKKATSKQRSMVNMGFKAAGLREVRV